MAQSKIAVFVLEDDATTRKNIERKIASDSNYTVAGSADSLLGARQQLLSIEPDVLLVDLQLPDGDGTDLITEYTARHPSTPILVISVFGDETRVVRALSAGAQGYLLKDDDQEDLTQSIRQVLDGQSPISPPIAKHLIRRLQTAESDSLWQADPKESLLSQRELEVLQLASRGLTYQETAKLLDVSINTVGTYTRRIYAKLAVSSRAAALFEARQLGLMKSGE